MTFCPNPNSEVFKRLEAAVGKNKSYYYWNLFEGNPTEADLVDLENSNLNDEIVEIENEQSVNIPEGLQNLNITEEQYNNLTQQEKDKLKSCYL